jgi:MATE family multidrug resistance protein
MNKEILRLALPNILSNISVPLLSTVDTALMGHLSSLHLAAVGISAMIFNLIYWNFGFLRMGTTGLTAQAFGENDSKKLTNTLGRALFLSLFISCVIIIFQIPIIKSVSYLLNIDQSMYPLVVDYFDIRIFAAPATLGLYVIFGWFFGVQNAMLPLLLTLFINILNIALSYYFVYILNLDIKGVAYGTVIAQYSGFILGIFLLYRYKENLQPISIKSILDKSQLSKFLNINRDIFFRTIALTFAFAFFYAQSAKEGEMALAITVILLQFLSWASFGIDGFAFAAESLVGKYYGAKDWDKFHQAIKYSFYWGIALATIYALVYYFAGEWILRIYTDKETLILETTPYLIWTVVMVFAGIAGFIWDGVFIGMTATRSMLISILLSLILYMTLFYISKSYHSLHLYWLCFILFLFMRGVIQSWMFYQNGKNLH